MALLISRIAAWAALTLITFATLVPIGLRPNFTNPGYEHFFAFAGLGFLFALAYPRRWLLVFAVVICSAGVLEALQYIDPTRHARWMDLAVKVAGGVTGISIGLGAPRRPR